MPDPFDLDPEEYRRLLARILMGDGVAERTLVSRVGPLIRRVVSRLAPPELREDLIQDVWAHFWARNCLVLQRWDGRGPFVHYVATVAGNLAKDRLRRLSRPAAPIEEAPDIADPDDPEQTLETRQLAECLDRAKGRLSETYRRMIHLRHELGLSHREIADNLDKSMGYVAGTLARAELYLREELWETCRDHLERFGAIFGRNE